MTTYDVTGTHMAAWLSRFADHLARDRALLDLLDRAGGLDEQAGTCAALVAKEAARSLADMPEDCGVGEALASAAQAGLEAAQGAGGIVVAHVLTCAAEAVDQPVLRPIECGRALLEVADALPQCLVGTASGGDAIALESAAIRGEVDLAAPDLDPLTLAEQAWTAAQGALVEADGRVVDALGAIVVIAFAALAHSEDTDALGVVHDMLSDLASGLEPTRGRSGHLRVEFTIDTDTEGAQAIARTLDGAGIGGVLAGRADLFGFGTWVVAARTDRPFAIVPAAARRVQVYTPTPLDLVESERDSTILLFERRPTAAMVRPAVIALVQARGIVEELAHAGVHVCWSQHTWEGDLRPILRRLGQPVSVIAAANAPADALARRSITRDGGDTEVILAPTANDLQVYHVASEAVGKVGAHLGGGELAGLQRARILQALEGFHTVELGADLQIEDVVTDHDRQVRVLIGQAGPARAQVVADLEAVSARLRVDLIQGDQPGPTIVGVASR